LIEDEDFHLLGWKPVFKLRYNQCSVYFRLFGEHVTRIEIWVITFTIFAADGMAVI
jgi:hypothetical protein